MKHRFLAHPLAVLLMMILLTFSQFVVAAYACADALASLPTAPAMVQMADMSDCVDMKANQQPLVCKAHCQKDSQLEAHKTPDLPAPQLFILFYLAPLFDSYLPMANQQLAAPPTLLASSPPLRIQYQVFRN
ncbi:hypothetical protein [Iodobacter sp.]|uniref:hypothetical protein n=1 Tax=Iodobacter sp. TaxID=1915058 RepID=UPI0025CC3788|nr:hypothetical protein [Iodobacter sp.]